jgi:dTDP-4-dehydrorhamnose reductase
MNKSKLLIVGSSGKLGSKLQMALKDKFDLDVCLHLDTFKSKRETGLIFCSYTKKSFALDLYEIIINCAWVAGVSIKSLHENILISQLLLKGNKNGAYVYLSTIDVYGNNEVDTYHCKPKTVFAFNKIKTEIAIRKIVSLRAKVIFRVGNYIPFEQISADSSNSVFQSYVDNNCLANLVDIDTLSNQIESISMKTLNSNEIILLNCVNKPNKKWGEVLSSLKRSTKEDVKVSRVSLMSSYGFFPIIFCYLKGTGSISLGASFVNFRVFATILISTFVARPILGSRVSSDIEIVRLYQDYTLRR